MKSFILKIILTVIVCYSGISTCLALPKAASFNCKPTAVIEPDHIPFTKILNSNNLTRKAEETINAKGNYIDIFGIILDENCVPIANAKIEMWQAGRFGNYKQSYEKKSKWSADNPYYDRYFAFSGKATSNNIGEFSFSTIFPGDYDIYAPHVNMMIYHKDFQTLSTMLFFPTHPKNNTDPNLAKLEKPQANIMLGQQTLPDRWSYQTSIVLEGISRYKKY